jgi:undecaprenyl-diphosphatase
LIIAYVLIRYGGVYFSKVVAQVLLSLLVCLTLYWIIKLLVRRRRPFDVFEEIKAQVPPLDKFSFPSGHTMNNLAVAATVCAFAPEVGWVMVLLPLTWGFLRVYFGVHWLSDVIGGFCLGIFSFFIGNTLWGIFGSGIINFLMGFQCRF